MERLAFIIMLKSRMHDVTVTVKELSKSRTIIQGFNPEGQRAISMISVELTMSLSSIFHVINAKTSHKRLLRQPWLQRHGIMAYTLHLCLTYYRDGKRKINGNVKPFTKVECHFIDARFFEEDDAPKESMLSTITSVGKGGSKKVIVRP